MLKKYIKLGVIFITLFSFSIYKIQAYEFKVSSNSDGVNDLIVEIFDRKNLYEDLVGENNDEDEIIIHNANNSSYWWPIGSEETVSVDGKIYAKDEPIATRVTSPFGYRKDPFSGETKFHSGVDIAGGVGNGIINIVAAKDGIVIYPREGKPTDCPDGSGESNCGGGYGNYVIIQHSDGNYTLYAHLSINSIMVTAGDSVVQGQVIGKMGSSGRSTGTHLHFEIREGQNTQSATVDPLTYVSIDNPRVVSSGDELLKWLNSWEGHSPIEGEYYIVEDIGDGVRSVGGGITLENNPERFLQYGIDIDDYPIGSKIPMYIVDQMQLEVLNDKRSSLETTMTKNSITLEETQINSLISMMYNTGNIVGFVDNYKIYGNTQEFYENWFFRNTMPGTKFERGLTRRRNAEWALFHTGEYVYNS